MRTLLLLLLLSFVLFAEEQFPFIGASVNYHTVSLADGTSRHHTTAAFRFGKQTLRWRTTFLLEYGNDYGNAGMHVDYIPFDTMFGTPKLRPYLGLNVNYLHYENSTISDSNGYSYGAQAGFIIYAADTVDIDIGYHYNRIGKIKGLDHEQGASISFHYFY